MALSRRYGVKALRESGNEPLLWTQPRRIKYDYNLRAGDEVVATLRWGNWPSQAAAAEAADGRWTFKRAGLLQQRMEIQQADTEAQAAVFQPGKRGGTLELLDGRTFRWQATKRWHAEWAWIGQDNEALIRFTTQGAFWKRKNLVELQPGAQALPECSLLVLFGWYLLVLTASDAALIASVSASVAVVG